MPDQIIRANLDPALIPPIQTTRDRVTSYSKETQLSRPRKKAPKKGYAEATERARTKEGFLICEGCKKGLLDRDAQRHHAKHRSLGGTDSADNLRVLCLTCHNEAHGI